MMSLENVRIFWGSTKRRISCCHFSLNWQSLLPGELIGEILDQDCMDLLANQQMKSDCVYTKGSQVSSRLKIQSADKL